MRGGRGDELRNKGGTPTPALPLGTGRGGRQGSGGRWPLVICLALAAVYALLAWTASAQKSATIDEPAHAATGWFMLWRGDYRLSPDVPPVWEDFISVLMGPNALKYDPNAEAYHTLSVRRDQTAFAVHTLYQTPGNDGLEIVRRGRMMALLVALALAGLIGKWAWELGGGVCAVAAMSLFCLDPNFLGHGPLVKNDVAITLAYLAAAYALWRCGKKLAWDAAAGAIAVTAVAVGVKFSGLLLGPVMVAVLGCRAIDGRPWEIFGRNVSRRSGKLLAALGICVATALFTYSSIWASYRFRFDPGPNGLMLDESKLVDFLRYVETFKRVNHPPTLEEQAEWTPSLTARSLFFAEEHHLLPQAWIYGYLYTVGGTEERLSYLAGIFYNGGRWYYFPLAGFIKSPAATIVALVVALAVGLRFLRRGGLNDFESRWNALGLGIPLAAYALVAETTHVNIGLRHAFPIYPFVFIAIGLAAGRIWAGGRAARGVMIVLLVGLAAETAAAFPNYISFVGVAAGGQSHAYDLLSDSNLDWGQDLPLLKNWQERNPGVLLYLEYFGMCDPAAYGIQYVNLPGDANQAGGYEFGPPPRNPGAAGVIAVSATKLHLLQHYAQPPAWFELIRGKSPVEVLGGTIYLFEYEGGGNGRGAALGEAKEEPSPQPSP